MTDRPTDKQYIAAAQNFYACDVGALEVDNKATVSRHKNNPDHGAYVQAWIWVADEDTEANQ